MITLRLFKASKPFEELESRDLVWGEFTIGRDTACDWSLRDKRGDLSRKHCVVAVDGENVFLRDTSTNGVFLGAEKRPAPRDELCELAAGDTIHLGEFMILVDRSAEPESDAAAPARQAASAPAAPVRRRGLAKGAVPDAALLEAFCRGARLETSSFVGEDPAEVMSRLGVVYRQVVDDLCVLMRDRATLKDQYHMNRTTISARDNNPMKWAPAERIAVELLQEGEAGFLKGAAAFRASFADLRRHADGLSAGSRAAVRYVLDELNPERLETSTKRQPLHFLSRFEVAWKQFRERYSALTGESGVEAVEQAFRAGYEKQLHTLNGEEEAA